MTKQTSIEWETFNNFLKWKQSVIAEIIAEIRVNEKHNIDHLTHLSYLLPQGLTKEQYTKYWNAVEITYAKWLKTNKINTVKYRQVYPCQSKNSNGETIQNLWFHNGLNKYHITNLLWESFTVDNLTTCYFHKDGK